MALLAGANNNLIGDSFIAAPTGVPSALTGSANLISGNGLSGVMISGFAPYNYVSGNYIGTQSSGTEPLGNGQLGQPDGQGVVIDNSPGNNVDNNLISGNLQSGVSIAGKATTGCYILSNLIGTDKTGTVAEGMGNAAAGVVIDDALLNFVGLSGCANVISGNAGDGVRIQGTAAVGNEILSNDIGTDAKDGSTDLHNGGNGVAFALGTAGNTVLRNRIAFNEGAGLAISTRPRATRSAATRSTPTP